jgi:WD40 repeat protein
LAGSGLGQTVRIWNLTTNTCKFNLTGHTDWVRGLKQITPSILASGSKDKTIKLWDILSGRLIRTLTGHTDMIDWSIDLLNNGETLVSGSWDRTIKLWNWSTGECLSTIQTTGLSIQSLAVIDMN